MLVWRFVPTVAQTGSSMRIRLELFIVPGSGQDMDLLHQLPQLPDLQCSTLPAALGSLGLSLRRS